jgi:hypothetical protein
MLQYMETMEASCIFYDKVGTLTYLEQSKTSPFSITKTTIVGLTVQHDFIVTVSVTYYPGDNVRLTSADILSVK